MQIFNGKIYLGNNSYLILDKDNNYKIYTDKEYCCTLSRNEALKEIVKMTKGFKFS